MHKVLIHKKLRETRLPAAWRLRGFSLSELIVSIGILVFMLSLAGQVLTMTVKSTGLATAVVEVNQQLRTLERTLRDDLRAVQPGRSMMAIMGNPISAYWTEGGKEIDPNNDPTDGYPQLKDASRESRTDPTKWDRPRADILMFFTSRAATSYVDPSVSSDLQQVVYGHADLGVYDVDGVFTGSTRFPDTINEPYDISASQWHLARRSVLLMPMKPPPMLATNVDWLDSLAGDQLDDEGLVRGETDVMANFAYEDRVLTPGGHLTLSQYPMYLPGIFDTFLAVDGENPLARSELDPAPPAQFAERLGHYFMPNCASFKVEWSLDPRSAFVGGRLDFEKDILWFDPGDVADIPGGGAPEYNPIRALDEAIDEANTPAQIVRWQTLKDLREKFLGGRDILDFVGQPENTQYTFWGRFRDDPSARVMYENKAALSTKLVFFTATRSKALNPNALRLVGRSDMLVAEDIFPTALRITVEMYDRSGRLDRPIRHVMVLPVGRS